MWIASAGSRRLLREIEKAAFLLWNIDRQNRDLLVQSLILSSDGLHAIGIRQVGNRTSRLVRLGESREAFFYNPMWRRYGHLLELEAGLATHHWQNGLAGELFWHMVDQVVIRPEECNRFPETGSRS